MSVFCSIASNPMIGAAPKRIFISYSRQDGLDFARKLRGELEADGLPVWHDVSALEGNRDWWSQIEEALRSKALHHLVLVLTPAALASQYVRAEIRLARQEGKTVSPVKGPRLDFVQVPRWVGHVYDLDIPDQRAVLIRVLEGPSTQPRVPMMAPEPPADFVQRPAEFGALKQKLLDAKGDAVAITAALRGAGGYGKTTLAKALAHDADIQDAFYDGTLWVELGEKPENLLSILSDLVEVLSGERPGVETINGAATKLGEALGDRRILLVIDDVWREQDLRPFLQGGRKTTRLITTRLNRVVPSGAERHFVDAMQISEARELLASGLPTDQVRPLAQSLTDLAKRLGEWAQLLKLVNGFLRDCVIESREPLREAIIDANGRLDEEGLVAFDATDEDDRTKAVARTINLSLGLLDEKQRARFAELVVFPEDADVPVGLVARFWRHTAGLSLGQTKDLLRRFYGLSLFLHLDLDQKSLRLHDTVRHFLQDQAGKDKLAAQHKRLLGALDDVATSADADTLIRRYYYQYLPHHLDVAGERERLDALLVDPGWLKANLAALHSPQALVADYDQHAKSELQHLIGRTLRLTMGICARDERQLIPQLAGRVMAAGNSEWSGFLDRAHSQFASPALLPMRPGLTPPGAETARLEGHEGWVMALCLLPDGRLASASNDRSIRLWDAAAGAETARLEGHKGWVNTLCLLPDGHLASGSSDGTIRLWDVAAGSQVARLRGRGDSVMVRGHKGWVNTLCLLPDGHLASGSGDGTIRLWDVAVGSQVAQLTGRGDRVMVLCVLPHGRLASGSADGTIRLWDVAAGVELARLMGHGGRVTALCLLPDGHLASGSGDGTIRLWDVAAGSQVARLRGRGGKVGALCLLPDGRLASASNDRTIRLWDVANGAECARLDVDAGVTCLVAILANQLVAGDALGRLHWLEIVG